MNTNSLISLAANIPTEVESIPLLLQILSISHADLQEINITEMENEADYALEHALETALTLLNSDQLTGSDLASASRLVADIWLPLEDIPGGTAREINVRSAEFLAASAPKTGIIAYPSDRAYSFDAVRTLVSSDDWKSRYLGALLAREQFAEKSNELLASLSNDPFEDEDGHFLVREAAGFKEDDEY